MTHDQMHTYLTRCHALKAALAAARAACEADPSIPHRVACHLACTQLLAHTTRQEALRS
jgi:hypothetical protein